MTTQTPTLAIEDDRPIKQAMWRGWRKRCAHCGDGHIMEGYLKVRDACPVCGEDMSHQRADDGPAYLTILLVGHILGFALHIGYVHLRPSPLVLAISLSVMAVALSLYLLPRLKGMLVAIQWSRRMHGFGSPAKSDT